MRILCVVDITTPRAGINVYMFMYANICPAHHASGTRSSDDTLYEQFIFYVNHIIHEKCVPLLHIKGLLHLHKGTRPSLSWVQRTKLYKL